MNQKPCLFISTLWLTVGLVLLPLGYTGAGPSGNSSDAADEAWETLPIDKLLTAAEAGNAVAQYYYWSKASDAARKEARLAGNQVRAVTSKLTAAQRNEALARSKTTPEAELREQSGKGDASAIMSLGILLEKQANDRAAATFVWLEKSAAQDFPPAEESLAWYALGEAGWMIYPVNRDQGIQLLTRAAEHGRVQAQSTLGHYYLGGERLPPDFTRAIEWYRKAADQGRPQSQYALAMLYANGNGEPRDESDTPLTLLRKAASATNNLALEALADRYRTGLGVPVDYVQAIQYYEAAAAVDFHFYTNGYAYTDSRAREIFDLVDGIRQPKPSLRPDFVNFAGVLGAWLKATEDHDSAALRQLGDWYATGRFEPMDLVAACRWYDRAARLGDATAVRRLDEIKPRLTPAQMKQAFP